MRRHVSDLLNDGGVIVYATPTTPVAEAVRKMTKHDVSSILVLDRDRELVGIFTERDLLRRVVVAGRNSETTPIEEVMTGDVITARPDALRSEVLQIMNERHIRHIPIADGKTLIGVISLRDVLRYENLEKDFEIEQLREYLHQHPNPRNYA